MAITLLENFRAVFYAPFYAASALGAYEAEGLDVKVKPSPESALTMQTLLSGAGEVSWGGPLRLMLARDKKPAQEPIAFCEAVGRDPFFLIGHEPNPDFKLEDLLDKTLGIVTEVPTPWMCLQHDMRLAGLDAKRIKCSLQRSMPDNAAALRAREIDVVQLFQPYAAELLATGEAHLWYAAATRGPAAYTTLNTTREYVDKNPQTVLAMCRAMYRTQKWIATHDGTALAKVLATYFPTIPHSTLAAAFDSYLKVGLWNTTPIMYREGFEWLRDAALADGRLHTHFEYDDIADMRFARQVIKEEPLPL